MHEDLIGALSVAIVVEQRQDDGAYLLTFLLVERWILAALRKRTFFSLGEVNEAIAGLLIRLNERPLRKREGSRINHMIRRDRSRHRRKQAARNHVFRVSTEQLQDLPLDIRSRFRIGDLQRIRNPCLFILGVERIHDPGIQCTHFLGTVFRDHFFRRIDQTIRWVRFLASRRLGYDPP